MIETACTYKDRDNPFTITFTRNGIALTEEEMGAIIKFELKYGGKYYNSVDHAAGFVRDDASAQVTVKPYELGLSAGKDLVEVIIYDGGDYQHGFVWSKFNWLHSAAADVA